MPLSLFIGTLGLLCLAGFAFWPTYLSKPFGPVDGYTHFHAAVGTSWLALLSIQSLLIVRHDRSRHRALGRISYVLAPLFVLSSVLLAHHRFSQMEPPTFERDAYALYLPLSAAALFAVAYCLAIRYRALTPVHGRLMACTALLLVDPVLGRFLAFYVIELPQFWHYQIITFGAEIGVLILMWRTFPQLAPGRSVFMSFAGVHALTLLLWFAVPASPAWVYFAKWFRDLPLT